MASSCFRMDTPLMGGGDITIKQLMEDEEISFKEAVGVAMRLREETKEFLAATAAAEQELSDLAEPAEPEPAPKPTKARKVKPTRGSAVAAKVRLGVSICLMFTQAVPVEVVVQGARPQSPLVLRASPTPKPIPPRARSSPRAGLRTSQARPRMTPRPRSMTPQARSSQPAGLRTSQARPRMTPQPRSSRPAS